MMNELIQVIDATDSSVSSTPSGKVRTVMVFRADRANGNRRVYPRAECEHAVARAMTELIPHGRLLGSTDHATFGGNMKDTSIIWRALRLNDVGEAFGDYSFVDGHPEAEKLKALVAAGGALGFSTAGTARAMRPTDEERQLYNLPDAPEDDEDDGFRIMRDWTIHKIDVVDRPACATCWSARESVNESCATQCTCQKKDTNMTVEDSILEMLADEDAQLRAHHARQANMRRSDDDDLMEGVARRIDDGFTTPLLTFNDDMLASI